MRLLASGEGKGACAATRNKLTRTMVLSVRPMRRSCRMMQMILRGAARAQRVHSSGELRGACLALSCPLWRAACAPLHHHRRGPLQQLPAFVHAAAEKGVSTRQHAQHGVAGAAMVGGAALAPRG